MRSSHIAPWANPDAIGIGALAKQPRTREWTSALPRPRPLESHVERAAVLLVLHAELVRPLVNLDGTDQRVHFRRRRAPNHEFAVQPDVEAVVARAVQFDFSGLGHVPETAPARAEEPSRQVRIIVQEVEGDRRLGVVDEWCAIEADTGEHFAVQAGPFSDAGADEEHKQHCHRGGRG